MNRNWTNWAMSITLAGVGSVSMTAPALADAFGASWGYLTTSVTPRGQFDRAVWNTDLPELWGIWAEGEVYHMHPGLTHDYRLDQEVLDPFSDGFVEIGPIAAGDLAAVSRVQTRVPLTGADPLIDMSTPFNVFSYAHDEPNSWSAAAGFGQLDNVFAVDYGGGGDPPETTIVTVRLTGSWTLLGYSDPDDNWWADWYTYVEVYDPRDPDGEALGFADEYHFLAGPGFKTDGGDIMLEFDIEIPYVRSYAVRFWQDDESFAIAVPEPGAIGLVVAGAALAFRRRRTPQGPRLTSPRIS